MQLEHTFVVHADPDATYAFLMDVTQLAACVPGVASVEQTAPDTFVGALRVKVGPVGITYRGTATITTRDPALRMATVEAEGTEGVGAGRVRAGAVMAVAETEGGSLVSLSTELEIAGKLAGFGRGIIEGVAKRIVAEMADCIRMQLERDGPTAAAPSDATPTY